jgi:hypothetical protein
VMGTTRRGGVDRLAAKGGSATSNAATGCDAAA